MDPSTVSELCGLSNGAPLSVFKECPSVLVADSVVWGSPQDILLVSVLYLVVVSVLIAIYMQIETSQMTVK